MHDSNVMHHGREEAIEGPRLPVVQLPFGRFIELQLRLSVAGCGQRQVGGKTIGRWATKDPDRGSADLDGDRVTSSIRSEGARARPPIGRVGRLI